MFINVSQASAGAAALGAHAVLFGSSRAAGFDGVAGEEATSSFADSSATSVHACAQNFTVGLSRFESAWLLKGPSPPPPGGGARRPGAPGAPSGGGSGNGGGPKRNMTVDDILFALFQLDMKRENISLTPEELAFLVEKGLIERMSDEDYDKHERSILRISLLEGDLTKARDERLRLIRSRNKLLQNHRKGWHRFWTGRKRLDEEAAELKWSAKRMEEISSNMRWIEAELKNLDFTKEYLATFVRTPYGYMRLSHKGEQLREEIKTRNRD